MKDTPDRLVPLDLWRLPRGWYWREWLHEGGRLTTASPWRKCDRKFAEAALEKEFFTLDEHPGVTFMARRVREVTGEDWRQVRDAR